MQTLNPVQNPVGMGQPIQPIQPPQQPQPQPVPPQPVQPVAPVQQIQQIPPQIVEQPPKKKSRSRYLLLGCLGFFVLLLAVAGFVGYQYWYVPGLTLDYLEAAEAGFDKVNISIDTVAANINPDTPVAKEPPESQYKKLNDNTFKEFNENSYDSFNSTLFGDDVLGMNILAQGDTEKLTIAPEVPTRKAEKYLSQAKDLVAEITTAKSNLKKPTGATGNLDNLLVKYYANSLELGETYRDAIQFFIDLEPKMAELQTLAAAVEFDATSIRTIADLDKIIADHKSTATAVETLADELDASTNNANLAEIKKVFVDYFRAFADYLNTNAQSLEGFKQSVLTDSEEEYLKSQNTYAKAQQDFLEALSKYDRDVQRKGIALSNYYNDKLDILRNDESTLEQVLENVRNEIESGPLSSLL